MHITSKMINFKTAINSSSKVFGLKHRKYSHKHRYQSWSNCDYRWKNLLILTSIIIFLYRQQQQNAFIIDCLPQLPNDDQLQQYHRKQYSIDEMVKNNDEPFDSNLRSNHQYYLNNKYDLPAFHESGYIQNNGDNMGKHETLSSSKINQWPWHLFLISKLLSTTNQNNNNYSNIDNNMNGSKLLDRSSFKNQSSLIHGNNINDYNDDDDYDHIMDYYRISDYNDDSYSSTLSPMLSMNPSAAAVAGQQKRLQQQQKQRQHSSFIRFGRQLWPTNLKMNSPKQASSMIRSAFRDDKRNINNNQRDRVFLRFGRSQFSG